MNNFFDIINLLFKLLFISSIIFIINIFGDFCIKLYARFKVGKDTVFQLTKNEKILLRLSISIFITYILK